LSFTRISLKFLITIAEKECYSHGTMRPCSICGADTMLLVNDKPLCLDCDANPGRKRPKSSQKEPQCADRSQDAEAHDRQDPLDPLKQRSRLVSQYAEATRSYAQSVQRLRGAAASLELDAYLWLLAECESSRLECRRLAGEISRLLPPNDRFGDPGPLHCD
jgi:hypothetical protein